jgi:Transposase, Mutator family
MTGISKSRVSRLCAEIDERVGAFLERPIEGDWPYLWIDATYVKVREAGRIVSVAVIIAVAVNTDSRREVLGLAVWPSLAAASPRRSRTRDPPHRRQMTASVARSIGESRRTQEEVGSVLIGSAQPASRQVATPPTYAPAGAS